MLNDPAAILWTFAFTLCFALTLLSWIDVKHFLLPDILTLPLISLGLLQIWLIPIESGLWRPNKAASPIESLSSGLIGAVVAYALFVAIEKGYKQLRGIDGLGRGDAKLLAAGGAWCGYMGLPFIILTASLAGLALLLIPHFRSNKQGGSPEQNRIYLPFGPCLALAIFTIWVSFRKSQLGF